MPTGALAHETPTTFNELDGEMCPSDCIEIPRQLPFIAHNNFMTIRIDKDARDYLVSALAARCGKVFNGQARNVDDRGFLSVASARIVHCGISIGSPGSRPRRSTC